MIKRILLTVLRIALGLGIAWATILLLVIRPHFDDIDQINVNMHQASDVYNKLGDGSTKMNALGSPEAIELRKLHSAKGYIDSFDHLKPTLSLPNIDMPTKYYPSWTNDKVKLYNSVVDDPAFIKSYSGSITAARHANDFLLSHGEIMKALVDLLEYDAAADTNNVQPDTLNQRLDAAAAGLAKAKDRINKAPKLKEDTTLQVVIDEIKKVDDARQAYRLNNTDQLRAQYIATVVTAQDSILKNRTKFWNDTKASTLKSMTDSLHDFQKYQANISKNLQQQ